MEEEIQGEERSADEAGRHGNDVVVDVDDDPWVKQMKEKLASKSKQCQPSHPFTICKVPRDIRGVDDAAHNPLVVSIGPYHRGDPKLLDMEQVKWRNLNAFRGRAEFSKYLKAMKEIEPRARVCYSGDIDMEADEFIEMMLLDGLFIIELFSNWEKFLPDKLLLQAYNSGLVDINEPFSNWVSRLQLYKEKEPIYSTSGMLSRVGRDMLILENQLPFFVLERLWNLTGQRVRFYLWVRAYIFIHCYTLRFENECDFQLLQKIFDEKEEKKRVNPEMINEDGVHHLLHLIYLLLISTKKSIPMEPTGGSDQSKDPTAKLLAFIKKILSFLPPRCHSFPSPSACQKSQFMECTKKLSAFIKKILPFLSPSKSQEEQPPPLEVIPCAAELDESGVEFQCVKAQSFLDVKFEQGTMKMPRLSVQDSTKSLLRNFIAYEQCFPSRGSHFTSYCCFMDYLVNTTGDVEILKRSAIIENRLGNDEEVTLLFNDLGKGIFLSDLGESYLGKSFKDVMKHTQKTWPKWRARLKHDYFSNPWAIISLIAATFVIFLTSVQTYYAAFT